MRTLFYCYHYVYSRKNVINQLWLMNSKFTKYSFYVYILQWSWPTLFDPRVLE